MNKRRNPYIDDWEPQCKVFLNVRTYNSNNMEKMKHIYDKTIGMLFEAANQKTDNKIVANDKTAFHESNSIGQFGNDFGTMNLVGKKHMKQTFFGKNGSFQRSGLNSVEEAPVKLQSCSGCSSQPSDPWEACTYCETPQCASCSVVCIRCNKPTCSNCSFPCYNNLGSVLCVSCSR